MPVDNPFEYNATGTYRKLMEQERGPRNIPAKVMNRIQAQLINAIQTDPQVRVSNLAVHVGDLEKYRQLSDPEKIAYVEACEDDGLLMGCKVIEESTDILDIIIARVRQLREPAPPEEVISPGDDMVVPPKPRRGRPPKVHTEG